jgi:hypothetical protein
MLKLLQLLAKPLRISGAMCNRVVTFAMVNPILVGLIHFWHGKVNYTSTDFNRERGSGANHMKGGLFFVGSGGAGSYAPTYVLLISISLALTFGVAWYW